MAGFVIEFKRSNSCPDANHPHWIDLGLPSGTQWACCNTGASKPEDYGNYYTFEQAQAYNPPSLGKIEELLDNTISEWTTQNGVNGRRFTGLNGCTLFLPAAGQKNDESFNGGLENVGTKGYYWSSEYMIEPDMAYYLYFSSKQVGSHYNLGFEERSVRPVRKNGN